MLSHSSFSQTYLTLLGAVVPVFVIVMAGFAIRRVNWLTEEADTSVMRIIVNLLFPCLILDNILGNPAMQERGNVFLAPVVGAGTVLLGFALCWVAAPLFGLREPRARRTFAFTVGLYNYGYIALPLVQQLFPGPTAGILFVHNLGVETALWTVGLALISGGTAGEGARWRRIFNAPVIAILTAVALHFLGARAWLPQVVLSAIHSVGLAAIPMGLLLTGATFYDQVRHLRWENSIADSTGACVLRLGVLPLCMLALARWLPAPIELRQVIVVQAAMPCAVIPVLLAKHYGGEPALALRIILTTSVLAMLTIPLWIQVGLRWIG